MPKIVGKAMLITLENAPKLAILNEGVVPKLTGNEEYFVIANLPSGINRAIMTGHVFRMNFRFTKPRSPDHFVDIERAV